MTKEELNKEIISCLKEQQKEYKYGSDAYNVLRKLETFIPNIVNESQLKPQEGERQFVYVKCKCGNEMIRLTENNIIFVNYHNTDKTGYYIWNNSSYSNIVA